MIEMSLCIGENRVLNAEHWGFCNVPYVSSLVMLSTLNVWIRWCLLDFSTVKLLYFHPLVMNKCFRGATLRLCTHILFLLNFCPLIFKSMSESCLQQSLLWHLSIGDFSIFFPSSLMLHFFKWILWNISKMKYSENSKTDTYTIPQPDSINW